MHPTMLMILISIHTGIDLDIHFKKSDTFANFTKKLEKSNLIIRRNEEINFDTTNKGKAFLDWIRAIPLPSLI